MAKPRTKPAHGDEPTVDVEIEVGSLAGPDSLDALLALARADSVYYLRDLERLVARARADLRS